MSVIGRHHIRAVIQTRFGSPVAIAVVALWHPFATCPQPPSWQNAIALANGVHRQMDRRANKNKTLRMNWIHTENDGHTQSKHHWRWTVGVHYGNIGVKPILIEWIDSVVVAFFERPKNVEPKNQFSHFDLWANNACTYAWTTTSTTTTELIVSGMTKRLLLSLNLMQFLRRHCCVEWLSFWLILAGYVKCRRNPIW